MRKFIIATISAIAMAFVFVGCSKEADKHGTKELDKSLIHGTWELTHYGENGQMIEVTPEMLKQIPAGIKMTFNANGTFKFENEKAGITAITGKYTIKGKDLNCKPDGKEEVKTLEIVSLSSQVLELKDTIEKDMILNMRFKKI